MVAVLLERAVQAEAAKAKTVDHLVLMTFDQGRTLILELDDTEDPNNYRSSIIYKGALRAVKRMLVGRVRRIQIEI